MASANDSKWQKDAADQNFDYMFKLLIIGNSSVGKTSFLFRYADDSFTSAFVSTVGIDFKVKTVFRQDKRVKLQIWVSLIHSFLRKSTCCQFYCKVMLFTHLLTGYAFNVLRKTKVLMLMGLLHQWLLLAINICRPKIHYLFDCRTVSDEYVHFTY